MCFGVIIFLFDALRHRFIYCSTEIVSPQIKTNENAFATPKDAESTSFGQAREDADEFRFERSLIFNLRS